MDNDTSADNIYVRTGTYFPEIRRQFNAALTISANGDITVKSPQCESVGSV